MMKKLHLLFIGLMVAGYLHAQTGWIEVNSNFPAGNGVGQISVGLLDENALWALPVNASGNIVDGFSKSTDGGLTWTAGTFNAGTGLSQLFAIDASTCWAVFNTGATQGLYKTVNGGTSWVKKGTAFGASSFANFMHFFNENDGLAQGDPVGGYYEIYTTNDGGETWTRVPSANIPAPSSSSEYGITGNYDAVGDEIWFGTTKGRIFHSTDKGLHWTAALTNFGNTVTVQPEFQDALNGIAFRSYLDIGLETTLGMTHDGGATWETVNVSGPMYARFITHIPGTESTFVGSSSSAGENGISYSTDGGLTWAAITEGYDFMASIWLDNETGWAGSIATAKRTTGGMYIYDGPPLEPFAVPAISLSADNISAEAEVGGTDSQEFTVSNIGQADLEYQLFVIYEMPGQKAKTVSLESQKGLARSLGYNEVSADPDARPASYNPPPADDFVLHYDGDNDNSFSWGPNVPYTIVNAAMFPPALTMPHAGMMITSVDMYFNELGEDFSLRIYDMGNGNIPGELLVDQPFTPVAMSWNTVTLINPVYITGSEIWVGYQYTQPVADNFIPGVDAGPANINGDWISFDGVGWTHLANYDSDVNWNIRANLSGTPIEQWLSVAPTSGVLIPGDSEDITVTCDATNLDVGTYYGVVRVLSNDPENPQIDIPVTFEVTEGGTPFSVILDFEEQADWAMTFDPWTAVDIDGLETYGFSDTDFPNEYASMAYIAFNPATTTPPMTDPDIQPHGGVRFGACMAAVPPEPGVTNNDWIISPQTTLGMNSSISLWVKAYTSDYTENYNVLVSTTDMDPGSFTVISGPVPMEAPNTWTEVTFDLSAYDGQTVYVAIQCVSNDAWVFMIDDVSIDFTVGVPDAPKEVDFTIYPNPVSNQMNITSGAEMTQIDIFNQLGQKVYTQVVKNTTFNMSTDRFNSGVYYVRITTAEGVATQKIMVK